MKRTFFVFATLLLSVVTSFAATFPQDGGVYRLVNVATGKAVTNGNAAVHNIYLSVADVDNASLGQEWTFVSLADKEPVFALFNDNYGQAVDMALSSSSPGKLLQWEATCTDNQSFVVNVVDASAGNIQNQCIAFKYCPAADLGTYFVNYFQPFFGGEFLQGFGAV